MRKLTTSSTWICKPFVTWCRVLHHRRSGLVGKSNHLSNIYLSRTGNNRLHVDIFPFCFHSFEVLYSTDSSKMVGDSPEVLMNFNQLFSNSTGSYVTNRRFFLSSAPVDWRYALRKWKSSFILKRWLVSLCVTFASIVPYQTPD